MSKLTVTTPNPNEIHMTRVFDAPRRLLIKAMSTPELIKRWLGGVRATVLAADIDFRVGGKYRYHFQNKKDGSQFAFVGVYKEISDDRIVHSEVFEGMPTESLVTTTFVEAAGKTTMSLVIRFETQAVRDMVLATGMADGAGESYDHLETLVQSL